tara:strand:- start:864 stop:1061 length:198 start_codon:yes stop_codon:yes gene_type:complete
MKYKLIKDWNSKRHNKIIKKGWVVIITIDSELEELTELGCIKVKKVKKKIKKKENKEVKTIEINE